MRQVTMVLLAAGLLAGAFGCAPTAVVRVNCGAEKEYVDAEGVTWQADRALSSDAPWGAKDGMMVERVSMKIPDTTRPTLYVFERYGMAGYEFAVDNGAYDVRLHFAETFNEHTAAGKRLFSVKINGQEKLKDLDVFKEAGGLGKPLVKECKGIAVTDGKLKIEFVKNVQNPEINAIEILKY